MDGRLESALRRLAWEYLERAQRTDDPRERSLLLERAALWHALATGDEQPPLCAARRSPDVDARDEARA
jgi:hypothetical protein